LRIELHMLFDVWNEELIKFRENKQGYSGIGLNELSLSLIDRVCRNMTAEEDYRAMMLTTGRKIEQMILAHEQESMVADELESTIYQSDSQWILYTQEALEYGFDIVKIIELELIFECLNDLHLIDDRLYRPAFERSESSPDSEELEDNEEEAIEQRMRQLDQQFQSDEEEDSFYR
jgi:hypothetical protein